MEQVMLEAAQRSEAGKGAARRARRDGSIPGVVYGMGKPTVSLSVERDAVEGVLGRLRGENVLFDLRVEGAETDADIAALLKEIQRHPVSRMPESIDFQWVSLKENVTVTVPIRLEGSSPAALEGAAIDQIMHEVTVSCLPLEIPEELTISIEGMELHETRLAEQIVVPAGVELLVDMDSPAVTCTPPAKIEEEPREGEELEGELDELAEGEEGEEGEEGAAEEGEDAEAGDQEDE